MQQIKHTVRLLLAKKNRRWVALGVLVLTFVLVVHFFVANPRYLEQLRRVSPTVIILVVILNIPAMAALAWAYAAIIELCGKHIDTKENLLLTAYSSIINFFGPLQSGPGVRAVYLKARHKIRVRDYVLATLMYYAFYATYCALFLLVGTRPWWQTVLGLGAVAGFSLLVIRWFAGRNARKYTGDTAPQLRLRRRALLTLGVAVFLQVVFVASYYYVELRAVNPHISVGQAISYTGAANFSLFVSITPDAVGFREAFLVLSQQIHHVSTGDIVNANIIDRGAYLIFLGLLFLVTLSIHARDRLKIRSLRRADARSGQ